MRTAEIARGGGLKLLAGARVVVPPHLVLEGRFGVGEKAVLDSHNLPTACTRGCFWAGGARSTPSAFGAILPHARGCRGES